MKTHIIKIHRQPGLPIARCQRGGIRGLLARRFRAGAIEPDTRTAFSTFKTIIGKMALLSMSVRGLLSAGSARTVFNLRVTGLSPAGRGANTHDSLCVDSFSPGQPVFHTTAGCGYVARRLCEVVSSHPAVFVLSV